MNSLTFLTDRFPPTEARIWKQHLQYELAGREYARTLVYNSHEEIPILPFYDSHSERLSSAVKAKASIGATLYCTDIELTTANINRWHSRGVYFFNVTLHDEKLDWRALFERMPPGVGGRVYWAFPTEKKHNELSEYLRQHPSWSIAFDPIAQLMRTGKWYDEIATDLRMPDPNLLTVDTTLVQQAGASMVQQLAYAMSHAVHYLNCVTPDSQHVKINFRVSVGGHFLWEMAKLRALRSLAEKITKCYEIPVEVEIHGYLSQRHLSLQSGSYNQNYSDLAYQSLYFGGSDYIFIHNSIIYEKNRWENEIPTYEKIQKIVAAENPQWWDGSHAVQALSYEIAKKALKLFQEIETSGGIIKHLENNILQRKVKEKAMQEQALFDASWQNVRFSADDFVAKNEWERYPFVKRNRAKTPIEPLVASRLWEKIERKIYF